MKILFGVLLALTCVSAYQNLDDFINEINTKQSHWKAGKNFHESQLANLDRLLGSKTLPEAILNTVPVVQHEVNKTDIPESFDARIQWPACKSINGVKDQSECGSSWAIAVSSTVSDRICIHSNGTLQPEISTKHLLTCDYESEGCMGGYIYSALKYWRDHGLVTGGDYNSKVGCQPYPFSPCEHHNEGPKRKCLKGVYDTPDCLAKCDNPSIVFEKDLHYGLSVYRVATEVGIQAEILKYGPVIASFRTYEDFPLYKSGVYHRTSDSIRGGLAVRIIGWGIENATKYWLVVNSWNEDWGDKGLFKVLRGVDECGIESGVYSGIPK